MPSQGFVQNGNIGLGSIQPQRLSSKNRRYTYDQFSSSPMSSLFGTAGGAAAGTTGATNVLNFGGGVQYEQFILGAGQTIIVPGIDTTTGLYDFSLDQTDNEGAEYVQGGSGLLGKHAYVIGTDRKFFTKLKFGITDASGTDELVFGFRKVQAFQTSHGYSDYAAIAIITKANPALIQTITNLNSGGESAVSTTQTLADAGTITFEVNVDASGIVKFLINGADPTVTQAFTFDTGDTVIPFWSMLHDVDVANGIYPYFWETGYKSTDDRRI